jgi:putative transposase
MFYFCLMARKGQPITLNEDEKRDLIYQQRSQKGEHRIFIRSSIILLLAEGKTYDEVMKELGVSRRVVAKWKSRFLSKGVDGLVDLQGRGKAAVFTPYDEARVVKLATTKPPGGYSNWSQERIGEKLGMSQSTVQRILERQQLKPHKTDYWCGKSTDPEFEAKMLNIVGLYLNPPENALVISIDEKTQIQALDRTQPELPLRPGNPKRLTTTYKRHGTVSLIAALTVHKGEITAKTMETNNAENFLNFLKMIYKKYPGKHLHAIADNLSVHKHHSVKAWVESKKRLTLHFTPTYSSWLNQIEIWFNILAKDVLKGAVWHSKKQLVDQLMEYIKTYNTDRAHPFRWTYSGKAED